jgi:hypothetical protein
MKVHGGDHRPMPRFSAAILVTEREKRECDRLGVSAVRLMQLYGSCQGTNGRYYVLALSIVCVKSIPESSKYSRNEAA